MQRLGAHANSIDAVQQLELQQKFRLRAHASERVAAAGEASDCSSASLQVHYSSAARCGSDVNFEARLLPRPDRGVPLRVVEVRATDKRGRTVAMGSVTKSVARAA